MPSLCDKCAASLDEGASICARCGAPITAPAPAAYAPTFSMGRDLEGIEGWLILVAIGLGIAPLRSIHGIYAALHVLYGSQYQHWLSMHPGEAGLILFEAVTNTLFLIALVPLNFLFYRKKRSFPGLMITFFALQLALVLIDHLVAAHFHPHSPATALFTNVLAAAICIPYYLRSERVKATFVH
jgi:Protein of unknown function (DUF2569)